MEIRDDMVISEVKPIPTESESESVCVAGSGSAWTHTFDEYETVDFKFGLHSHLNNTRT